MPLDPLPRIVVLKGRSLRLRRGSPWLFSNEIEMTEEARALPPGTVASVYDAGGEGLGTATFNPHSLIAARLLSRQVGTTIDADFFSRRICEALNLRTALFPKSPYYRLVHAEADGLPGLIVDRYGDIVSLQCNTAGMDALSEPLLEAIGRELSPRAVVARNDSPVRSLEGLKPRFSVLLGAVTEPVLLQENGVTFFADVATGQKTGWFFDQRPNRAFTASLAKGRTILDVFSYAGGFGVTAAAYGAKRVVLVDRSAEALALGRAAGEANGVSDALETVEGDGFKALEAFAVSGRRFGVVVADPPAFAKSKKDVPQAAKGYRKMARLAAALVEPQGFLLCGSCSHHMESGRFFEEVVRGVAQAGRGGRVLWMHGAGPDHPVHPSLPESAYLKVVVLALD